MCVCVCVQPVHGVHCPATAAPPALRDAAATGVGHLEPGRAGVRGEPGLGPALPLRLHLSNPETTDDRWIVTCSMSHTCTCNSSSFTRSTKWQSHE